MVWAVVKCARFECSRYMVTQASKRKKCPYCGRSFKVKDNFVKSYRTQDQARMVVKKLNSKL